MSLRRQVVCLSTFIGKSTVLANAGGRRRGALSASAWESLLTGLFRLPCGFNRGASVDPPHMRRGPVANHRLAFEVLPWNEPPKSAVVTPVPVVAEDKELPSGNLNRAKVVSLLSCCRRDSLFGVPPPRVLHRLAVDQYCLLLYFDLLAWQPDDALNEVF